MTKGFGKPGTAGRAALVGLVLVGAPLACRKNGPQGGSWGAPNVASDAGSDAGAVDGQALGDAALGDGGKACTLGGATQTAGTQVLMFREAADFSNLLAAADAGANQQQRTEQFRNAGGILVPFGSHCTVLETMSAVVKVQVTDGSWVGTLGWVPADSLSIQ